MGRFAAGALLLGAAACGAHGEPVVDAALGLATPQGLSASDGSSPEQVEVTWVSVDGAVAYRLFRDGALIAEVNDTSYSDAGATPGGAPPPPPGFVASDGSNPDHVDLTWSESEPDPGSEHTYVVTASDGADESPPSDSDTGFRGPYPILDYELSTDGGAFDALGLVLGYTDATTGPGSIAPGQASASDGIYAAHVALTLSGTVTALGETHTYALRARSAAGSSAPATDSGFRGVGDLVHQWQRSAGPSDADYTDIAGASGAAHFDTEAPADGEVRYYRCHISGAGADPVVAAVDLGWRRQQLDPVPADEVWTTNEWTNAIAYKDGIAYLGGYFTQVGPNTGPFAEVDPVTGAPTTGWARANGPVYAMADDGAGGWFIGGDFYEVDGAPHWGLAHLDANGALDPSWTTEVEGGRVYTMQRVGNVLYLGGEFGDVGGQYRDYLAAVDITTGIPTPFAPHPDDMVFTLQVVGNTVYVGGAFTQIGSAVRRRMAAFDATTGALKPWTANANDTVFSLAVSGTSLYVGGNFTTIKGQPRQRIAELALSNGAVSAWDPGADNGVWTFAVGATELYVGGWFTTIGGEARNGLATVDRTTGAATAWNPDPNGRVSAILLTGTDVVVGGGFTTIGGQPRHYLARLDATGNSTAWRSHAGNEVSALAEQGGKLYVGGSFNSVGGELRNGLAAIDLATGSATEWDPGLGGGTPDASVHALAIDGDLIYVGGDFDSVGGQPRNFVAAVDLITGQPTDWAPDPDGGVLALAASEGTIYMGGVFEHVGAWNRTGIAAVDQGSGLVSPWNPNLDDSVMTIVPTAGAILVGGWFHWINGLTRHCFAALDATTAVATSWSPNEDMYCNGSAIVADGDTVYLGGVFDTLGGQVRQNIGAVDAITGVATSWDPGGAAGGVEAMARFGNSLYVGGVLSNIGGAMRRFLAELDTSTAVASVFDPMLAASWVSARGVLAIATNENGTLLMIGGDFETVGGKMRGNFAVFEP